MAYHIVSNSLTIAELNFLETSRISKAGGDVGLNSLH